MRELSRRPRRLVLVVALVVLVVVLGVLIQPWVTEFARGVGDGFASTQP